MRFELFLIAGAAVAAGYYGLRFLTLRASRPPAAIHLAPIDGPRRSDGEAVARLAAAFRRHGFEAAGDYRCLEMPLLVVSGFVQPAERIAGAIYDHPARGVWVDVFVHYGNGGSFTASNAPAGHELDRMPGQAKVYRRGGALEELLATVRTQARDPGRTAIAKEQFASRFEAQYRKEMRWRSGRGGPTYLEEKTRRLRAHWEREGRRAPRAPRGAAAADLPREFQDPEAFRLRVESSSGPPPRPSAPALPVYLALLLAMAAWVHYGYRYNQTHFPASLPAIIVFFAVFLVPFLALMAFREFNRRVRLYPVLRRLAGARPGAFLVVEGASSRLFYAREAWIGMVSFREGGENEDACTCLEARTRRPLGALEICARSGLGKVFRGRRRDDLELPRSDLSEKYAVRGEAADYAARLLDATLSGDIARLAGLGKPRVELEAHTVRVEVDADLSGPRREDRLRRFLEAAESAVEKAAHTP